MSLGGRYFSYDELKAAKFRRLGKNVQIHNRASVYGAENISIGDNVRVNDFVVIIAKKEVEIGSYVHIPNFCYIGGTDQIILKDFVTLAPGVMIFTASDDYLGEKLTGAMVPPEFRGGKTGKVILEKHVIIGAGSIILPGVNIGEGCAVGALSLVKDSLEPWRVYAGIPAKYIKNRKKDLLELERKIK